MALLQVRDFPPDLYEELGRVAQAERRSIAQQTVVLLAEALASSEPAAARRQRALADSRRRAEALPRCTLDPVALIREDRAR